MTRHAIEDEILAHFQSLMRHVSDTHAPEFLGVELTMAQAKVLYVVSLRPGMTMSALATEVGVGLSAASGIVDRLVASRYIDRREGPADRRQQLLTVTPAGAAALDRMRELRAEMMRRLLAELVPAELRALRDGIAALDRAAQHLAEPSRSGDARGAPHAPHAERTPA